MIIGLHGSFIFLTYAMDKVADPFPAFASTTSVPPSCVLLVRALISSADNALVEGVACKKELPLVKLSELRVATQAYNIPLCHNCEPKRIT